MSGVPTYVTQVALSNLAPPSVSEDRLPRYFFHLRDGSEVLLDAEGRQLADLSAAATHALREARSLISHEALGGRIDLDQRIEVEDAGGEVVCRIEFIDAVEVVGGGR